MPAKAETGTLFIREGTILPSSLHLEADPYIPGWRSVKNLDSHGLDREISGAGWTFFCLAGEIQATVFGRGGPDRVSKAVKRILARLKSSEFNCLEVTGVVSTRFLGIPCTKVHARSRHIQESVFLLRAKDVQEWKQPRLAAAQTTKLEIVRAKGLA